MKFDQPDEKTARVEDRSPASSNGTPAHPTGDGLAFNARFAGTRFDWDRREVAITDESGREIFRQSVSAPTAWSDLARKVVASKYFYGLQGSPEREDSVEQLCDRVVWTIAGWAADDGMFRDDGHPNAFGNDLQAMVLGQIMAFNSPVWFNVGVDAVGSAQGWRWDPKGRRVCGGRESVPMSEVRRLDPPPPGLFTDDDRFIPHSDLRVGDVIPCEDAYKYPQASACFIQSVEDSMAGIMALATSEAMLFKYGSGTGTDLSTLRSCREHVAGGGRASGPVSFMRIYDAIASVVKSGGKCLAPDQPVFTASGPATAGELADSGRDFVVLSYSRRLGRVAAKTARAWRSAIKNVVEVVTDKGAFRVSDDHPFMLKTGRAVRAGQLRPGMSLFKVSTSDQDGYIRVGLQDGLKGRALLHQMVARDVLGWETSGKVVHHEDEVKTNCVPGNLRLKTQAQHAADHGRGRAFYPGGHRGSKNGMNRLGRFWKDPAKSSAYRKAKAEEMKSRKPAVLQAIAARVKMLNVGYELLNAGHDLSTFDSYITAREAVGRRVPSVPGQREKFVRQFGSYEGFLAALAAENHRVVEVRPIGLMGVVSVEVDDPEPDDKRDWSEHNYVLAPFGVDSPFLSGVAVLNTRRAAKMQTLKVTHPDIVDFIQCKAKEDRKARALVAAGWPNTMSGHPDEAYSSVLFQNSNLSVRATDEFMDRALVTNGADWTTWGVHERLQSFSTGMPAKVILDMIAECALECGDPGMQFEDTIQRWHTCPNSGPINSSNPCTEFMFLDDTACNLASINVVRFWDGSQFDVAGFRHAVRATIIAQETLVDHGSYPTEEIAANSHRFRPLGLGLANIGGLLMRMGIPYDSDLGRSWAAALSSLMTAVGYETSAGIAEVRGPFDEYAENRDPMMKVIRQHVHAASVGRNAAPDRTPLTEVWTSATQAWDRATLAGSRFGYRNAQISLYAPTGTIAFMMDCDTTGIEPAVALVSDKSLAGGGVLRMECPAVGPALERLGYSSDRAFDILQGLNRTGTLEGYVEDEHLPIFDTAMPDASGRSLSWEAHVKMIAAVQPHVSGAISKTINMPSTSTAKDVRDAYVEAWRLGIKALAIYVDGSKGVQPVNAVVPEAAPATEDAPVDLRAASVNTRPDPYRERLPDTRESVTHKFTVGAHEGYVTVGFFPGTRRPGELFVKMAKEGSTIGGLMDSVGTLASINLQYGVPLEVLVRKFAHASFEPAGPTQYPDLPFARSVVDYVFRWLGMEFLPGYREANAPRRGGDEDRPGPRDPGPRDPDGAAVREVEGPRSGPVATAQSENPACDVCGALTFRCGTCYRCFNCGNSLGCS